MPSFIISSSLNKNRDQSNMQLSIFLMVLVSLFTLELIPFIHEAVILPFTSFVAYISAAVASFFDSTIQADGIVMRSLANGTAVKIMPGCNGVEAMICLAAAIIAFPASWMQKVVGLFMGFTAIQLLNIVRIISLFYLLQWNKDWFEWAHLYIWQALIILDALIIFILWVRWLPLDPDHEDDVKGEYEAS